jgi:hypothetical protein
MKQKEKESPQIKRYRRKLKEQIEHEHEIMNEAALKKVKQSIIQRLTRTNYERISLQDKTITLFDENRHPEPIHSKFVNQLFAQIRDGKPLNPSATSDEG